MNSNNVNNGKFTMESCTFVGEIGGGGSAGLIAGAIFIEPESWIFDDVLIENSKSKCNVNESTCVALIGQGLPENFYAIENSHNDITIN